MGAIHTDYWFAAAEPCDRGPKQPETRWNWFVFEEAPFTKSQTVTAAGYSRHKASMYDGNVRYDLTQSPNKSAIALYLGS